MAFNPVCRTLCAVALLLAACGDGGGDADKPGVLSISAMPRLNPYPATPEQIGAVFTEALQLAKDAGARGQVTTYRWSELEPGAAGYDTAKLAELDAAVAGAQGRGDVQFVGIQVLNTSNRELPADLQASAFDAATVKQRLRALLDQVLKPANRGRIRYLSIGNEVDAYLRAHPAEWATYQSLYEDAVAHAHALDPAVKVGVTATADQVLLHQPAQLAALNAVSDVIMLTYYPLDMAFAGGTLTVTVRDPAVVGPEFRELLAFAGNRPLVFQEVGYPAATSNGSSEAMQAQFVVNIFAAWKDADGRVPLMNYFLLHDFTRQMCQDLGSYYGAGGQGAFEDFLCTLGLRHDDGTPRQAWTQLRQQAAAAGLP